jgi:hypothetical protein
MQWTKMAVAALAVTAASPAMAQVELKVGGVGFAMALPGGYCVPSHPDDVARMKFAESLDGDHVTLVSLVPCKRGDMTDYILIKAPKRAVNQTVTLDQLMRQIGPEFDRQNGNNIAIPATEAKLGGALSAQHGESVDVALALGPRGRDKSCAYIGGTVRSDGLAGNVVAVGGCITAIGGRMLMVTLYGAGDKPETVSRLLRNSRAIALTIKPK